MRSRDGSVIGFRVSGEGPPLLLVHGAAVDGRSWAPVVPHLAERFTVHVMDRRGRGLSLREGGPYRIEREGEDIAAVAEAAGRGVFLVAHSFGALCALRASPFPAAVGRAVLYEPPLSSPWRAPTPPEVIGRLRGLARAGDHDGVLAAVMREVLGLSARQVDALRGARRFWRTSLDNAPPLVRETESVGSVGDLGPLSGIGVPVRLLVGERSPAYQRPTADALAALIPGAGVTVLKGQGHMAMLEDPALLAATLSAFAG